MDDKLTFLEKPIFILGSARSGTTLIQTLFDSHNQILNIPAELHYYMDWKMLTMQYGKNPDISFINEYFFKNSDIGYFGNHVRVGAGLPYDTTSINRKEFRKFMKNSGFKRPSSKEYLQLLVKALLVSNQTVLSNKSKYKYFLCCMNVLYINEILKDFPQAKIIIMDRDKADVYVSQRRFWVKNFASYYNPKYRHFPKFHFRRPYVINMIIENIKSGIHAKNCFQDHNNVLVVNLDRLVKNQQEVIGEIASWLDINITQSLYVQTMCGKLYGGNLTTGENTQGKIVKTKKRNITKYDLNIIEYWILRKLISGNDQFKNIDENIINKKYNWLNLILGIIKLLPMECYIKSKKIFLRFPITYLMNRIILIRYLMTKTSNQNKFD